MEKNKKAPELLKLYAPITKIDEEKRMVFGYATTDSKDTQDEVVDLQASFDAVDEYTQWRTVKEMHRPETAAGTAPILEKHTGVGLYVGAEIVDDQAWKKCLKKVYKGFSIGGYVLKRDPENSKRITKYRLVEISLVDRPANPDSLFSIVKRDNTTPSQEGAGGDNLGDEEKKPEQDPTKKPETEPEKKPDEKPEEKPENEPDKDPAKEPEKPASGQPQPSETTPVPELVAKKDFETLKKDHGDLKAKYEALEKQMTERLKEDEAFKLVLHKLAALDPKMKKIQTVMKTAEELAKEKLSKMSDGEIFTAMLKRAPVGE